MLNHNANNHQNFFILTIGLITIKNCFILTTPYFNHGGNNHRKLFHFDSGGNNHQNLFYFNHGGNNHQKLFYFNHRVITTKNCFILTTGVITTKNCFMLRKGLKTTKNFLRSQNAILILVTALNRDFFVVDGWILGRTSGIPRRFFCRGG